MTNYPLLKQSDHLPAVAVLQKLLNRRGAGLKIDGKFGPKTKQAVVNYQRRRNLTADGIVDVNTWPKVAAGADLPIVDCVDIFDPLLTKDTENPIRKVGGRPVVLGGMCNGVEQAVQAILAASPGNVFLLRFHGHGAPGVAGASFGKANLDPNMSERSSFDTGTLSVMLPVVMRLRGVFGPYGCIQFMHCKTGRGRDGRTLLNTIANAVGVPVSAAVDNQYGLTKGPLPFGLTGPIVTAVPGGIPLALWANLLPEFAAMSAA